MDTKDRKLGVAIHGAGWVAKAHAAGWQKNQDTEIISISSRRRESAQRLVDELGLNCSVHDSLETILQDDRIDIVDITGPNHVHAEQGVAAAAYSHREAYGSLRRGESHAARYGCPVRCQVGCQLRPPLESAL